MKLPYRATTDRGEVLDVEFPLHADTGAAVRVEQLLSAVLDRVTQELRVLGSTSNGDVLQALAMALAVRAGIVAAPRELTERLARELLESALGAVAAASRTRTPVGHA